MKRHTMTIAATLMALALAGCATSEQEQRAGAGAGALAGQAIGRDTRSTVVGAGAGALLGAVVGTATTPQRRGEEMCRYRGSDGRIYVARCDDRYYDGNY